jgi:hypothetical protein
MATQFHPEKSGTTGLRILKTFLDKCVRKSIKWTRVCLLCASCRWELGLGWGVLLGASFPPCLIHSSINTPPTPPNQSDRGVSAPIL